MDNLGILGILGRFANTNIFISSIIDCLITLAPPPVIITSRRQAALTPFPRFTNVPKHIDIPCQLCHSLLNSRAFYSDRECAICHEPLLVAGNKDPLTPSYVIDDVELSCKHHFHQSCILEYAASSADARERCAVCRAKLSDSNGGFWVTFRTENGAVGQMDLGRDIDEQAYLKSHPEAERAQIFLSLMAQMDFEEAETLLKGEDDLGNGHPLDPNVTYEYGGQTAMHMAALNNDTEGVELLLKYGADKKIKDEEGKTALDLAKDVDAQAVIRLLSNVQH